MTKVMKRAIRRLVLEGRGDEVRVLLLTPAYIRMLEFIAARGETTVIELAENEGVRPNYASGVLASLHRRGYVGRVKRMKGAPREWQYVYKEVGMARFKSYTEDKH